MIGKFFKSKGEISQIDFCQANGLTLAEFSHLAKDWIENEYQIKVRPPKNKKRRHRDKSNPPFGYVLFGFQIND